MDNLNQTIVLFSAAHVGNDPKYVELAYHTGSLVAEAGFTMANGAGPGLMEASSKGAKDRGGKTIGVGLHGHSPNPYSDIYRERVGIHARQSVLFSLGDAFIGLPGGMGTFYEALEIAELKKLEEEESEPVILINLDGFFDGFKMQLDTMRSAGFIPEPINQYIDIVETPEHALQIIKSFYGIKGE